MRASAFGALLAAALAFPSTVSTTRAGDDFCFVPRYPTAIRMIPVYAAQPSPYACTEPAPASHHPPVHIPNPFFCVGPNCPPSDYSDPYRREPIPLPNPPPTGYGTFPYNPPSYGNTPYNPGPYNPNPYNPNPYNPNPYGPAPNTTPFGPPPGGPPLTPREHPGGRKGPIISQSSTLGGVTQYLEPAEPLCKVSFWNQTGVDVTLIVGDRTSRIQRDRAVVLSLPRDFTWKTDGTADKREQVASDHNYFDIVIR